MFEEEAADQYKRNKELKNQASRNSGIRNTRVEEVVEIEIGDEEDDE